MPTVQGTALWPVQPVARRFGLAVQGWRVVTCKPNRAVLRLQAVEGEFCLKAVQLPGARLRFVHAAAAHLAAQGVPVVPLLCTARGRPYVTRDGWRFLIMPWVPGRRPRYRQGSTLEEMAALLALVHRAGQGFVPPERPVDRVDNWLQDCAAKLARLPLLRDLAERRGGATCRLFLDHYEWIYARALWALARARDAPAAALVDRYRRCPTLGHRDFNRPNTIRDPAGRLWLVDLDSLAYTLPAADLLLFVRHVAHDLGWRRDWWERLLAAYTRVRPLAAAEVQFVHEQLAFPRHAIDLVEAAVQGTGGEPPGLAAELAKALACDRELMASLGVGP